MRVARVMVFLVCAIVSSAVVAPVGDAASSPSAHLMGNNNAVMASAPLLTYSFEDWISAPPLVNDHYWVLTGTRLADGACRYDYTQPEATLPASGWEIRSVAIDFDHCAKLMEEGTPTARPDTPEPILSSPTSLGVVAPDLTAYYAWQQVTWKDIIGIVLNYDVTQIGWTSDGSTVTSGITAPYFYEDADTGWRLDSYQVKHTLASDHSSYMGNTISTFHNSQFCWPLPTVYTYYYYNKMWGFPDGHATRSQNSDTVDECVRMHFDIYSAYGQFQP